jgi:mannan endo-1,4-beta-mannosidase
MQTYPNKAIQLFTLFALIFLFNCCKKNTASIENRNYAISGNKILIAGKPAQLIGANALHIFSAGGSDMNPWKIDISREFIGNVKEVTITGYPIRDANGSYLYSLQTIVDSNRIGKRITILCPFGWDGTPSTVFSGLMPSQTSWWNDFKNKLLVWAVQFKDQPDVWIELWNEPYRYDRTDGYTDDIWLRDMNELIAVIRNAGNNNVIVVPCAEQGQDETVLINKGAALLTGKQNILFDIHAYEKWLLVSNAAISSRLQNLKNKNLPVIFGETAPLNAGVLMNPQPLLDSLYSRGISVCAWLWKYDENDKDALLTSRGEVNDMNNNNWGTTYRSLCLRIRNP